MKTGIILGLALLLALVVINRHQVRADGEHHRLVVTIEGMKFTPDSLHVRVGDEITFKNGDLFPHTATARVAGAFDSGIIKPGESWSFRPAIAGSFDYSCTFHPVMLGKLVIESQ